ncbi:PstS family phosphate ABC transporter substrate-binding protein [Sphingobacterium sp. SGR-19]|uniref:PstS family phosphate ABC transporter substrate-binding protein n=1 Tax=Sphingobacterium sp. SGR-19 TaxID=2710886 RepID=UPI0013EBEE64|nr:substrate-binding domain-containing protein [Sphingobacterium sp. SGR-19]NGM65860.1 phosphate ABC transporter [Sphingobacterium sp. SGR-19]
MKQIFNISILAVVLLSMAGCSRCSRTEKGSAMDDNSMMKETTPKEDVLAGALNVAVDETVYPLVKEQEEVFLSAYPNARLNLIVKPELLAIRAMLSNEAGVAVLARELNETERDYFKKRSIKPRIFPVWTDAIVVINNTKLADTTVTIEYLVNAMKGESTDRKKIIFDNLNSSTFRHLKDLGKLEKVASNFVEAIGDSEKVLEAVANDPGKVGILGYNVYLDLISSFPNKNNIRILSVQNTIGEGADNNYYRPNQSTIAAAQYPLSRTFYVLNYQPNLGLGIGFSAFLTGDRGQRIVLKSGLVPATMPGRDIIIRDEINL